MTKHPVVRAKFKCYSKTEVTHEGGHKSTEVHLRPVCADDLPENQRFHRYTPSGELKMIIDNPSAVEALAPGKTFYVDFTPAD